MSELINIRKDHIAIRGQLLVTASALALAAYLAGTSMARAGDADRPTVWIELGGQLERQIGSGDAVVPPFVANNLDSDAFKPIPPISLQKLAPYGEGEEAGLTFQPRDSDWMISATIRYGRGSATRKHVEQTARPPVHVTYNNHRTATITVSKVEFSDAQYDSTNSQTVLDFMAGRDVGVGMFGVGSTSVFSAGVRFVQFLSHSNFGLQAIPHLYVYNIARPPAYFPTTGFNTYAASGHVSRSFHGVGPSVSWKGAVPFAGNSETAEFTFDWGINAAVLFGKQRMSAAHKTSSYCFYCSTGSNYQKSFSVQRARSVTVPNLGGLVGMSLKFPNARVSLGYRADFFFGALDGGIDTRKSEDRSFYGPFATFSIGLGG